jgi:5-methylcytosine-specific restriction endonuclease McrA
MPYKDRDRQRKFQVEWRRANRNAFIESRGGCCEKCESIDRLEVDHIDGSLKTMNPTRIWSRTPEIQTKELANCQVLCYRCHKQKTSEERQIDNPHGVYAKYKDGCRCADCRAANAERSRIARARRRGVIHE